MFSDKFEVGEFSLAGLEDDVFFYPYQYKKKELASSCDNYFLSEQPPFEYFVTEEPQISTQNIQPTQQSNVIGYSQYPVTNFPNNNPAPNPMPPQKAWQPNRDSPVANLTHTNLSSNTFFIQNGTKKNKRNSRIHLDTKSINRDSFLKRTYVFADDHERTVSMKELREARFSHGKVLLGEQELIWSHKRHRQHQPDEYVELDGKVITWDAFLKRTIFFRDNLEVVSLAGKKRAHLKDGKAFVDGRETFWRSKMTKPKYHESDFSDDSDITLSF